MVICLSLEHNGPDTSTCPQEVIFSSRQEVGCLSQEPGWALSVVSETKALTYTLLTRLITIYPKLKFSSSQVPYHFHTIKPTPGFSQACAGHPTPTNPSFSWPLGASTLLSNLILFPGLDSASLCHHFGFCWACPKILLHRLALLSMRLSLPRSFHLDFYCTCA